MTLKNKVAHIQRKKLEDIAVHEIDCKLDYLTREFQIASFKRQEEINSTIEELKLSKHLHVLKQKYDKLSNSRI